MLRLLGYGYCNTKRHTRRTARNTQSIALHTVGGHPPASLGSILHGAPQFLVQSRRLLRQSPVLVVIRRPLPLGVILYQVHFAYYTQKQEVCFGRRLPVTTSSYSTRPNTT